MKAFNTLVEVFVALFLIAALMSLPVMLLWDWLMPALFGLKEITWFQAWGLLWLTGILFRPSVYRKD
jgi:hypothetical protein